MKSTDRAAHLASVLCLAAERYEPHPTDDDATVIHDLILAILDAVPNVVPGTSRPEDKHLPKLFKAIDEAIGL